MKNKQIPVIDLAKEENFLKIISHPFFVKVYETALPGQGLLHDSHPPCEYDEHSFQKHGVVVHLKPEHNSLRRLGDSLKVENVNVGDVAIIPANVNHWQRIETKVTEAIVLTIEPQIISQLAYETVNSDKVELLPTFARPDPLIQHLALNLQANLDSVDYDRLYAESLFHALSMHLLRHYCTHQFNFKQYPGGLPPYKLKQAIEYINDNLDQKIKLDDVAQLLDISQFYFSHMFKESTGIPPYKYVIKQRLERAKLLIKQSKLPLAEIALESGFTSQSQMTQHFRKCVGVTPKAYRNQL